MALISAVVRDPGGTNGLLPVVRSLRNNFGHDVRLIANGTSARLLVDTDENYEVLRTVGEAVRRYSNSGIRAMLTSMCYSGGIGQGLIPVFKRLCPTISFHDYWGTSLLRHNWECPEHHPDFIVVNDQADADIVLGAWPDYNRNQVVITGYPMFDKYAVPYDEPALKVDLSSKLGLDLSRKPIIVSACGVYRGTSLTLLEIINVLNELGLDIYFVPRIHPRLGDSFPKEMELCQKAINSFRGGTLIADSSACAMPDLIRTASIVISDFSTALLETILVRKSNISLWYLDPVREAYDEEFMTVKHLMPEPPFLTYGCSARPTDRVALGHQISGALNGKLNLRAVQEKYFPLDGNNARRAAEFVCSLI